MRRVNVLLSILKCTLRRNSNEQTGPARPPLRLFLESVKLERSVASKRVRIWARKTCVTAPPGGNLRSLEAVGAAVEQNAGSSVDLIASLPCAGKVGFNIATRLPRRVFFLLYLCEAAGIIHQKLRVEPNNFEAESELGRRSLSRLRERLLFIFLFFRVKLSPSAGR